MKVSPRNNQNGRLKVQVFSSDGTELVPCNAARARRLVKNKKAKVRTVNPYSIELNRGVNPDA